jgi:hypothetical protein
VHAHEKGSCVVINTEIYVVNGEHCGIRGKNMKYNTETDRWTIFPETFYCYEDLLASELDGRITMVDLAGFCPQQFDTKRNEWSNGCTLPFRPAEGSVDEPICSVFKMSS